MPAEPTNDMIQAAYPLLDLPQNTEAKKRAVIVAIYKEFISSVADVRMMGLTRRQSDLYNFVLSFNTQYGVAPTYKEMAENLGWSFEGTAKHFSKGLIERGVAKMVGKGKHRGLLITKYPNNRNLLKQKLTPGKEYPHNQR